MLLHIGVESKGMKYHIMIVNDIDPEVTVPQRVGCCYGGQCH